MNTLETRNDNFAETNSRGTDRFLRVTIGTTPGAHSIFSRDDRHRGPRRQRRARWARYAPRVGGGAEDGSVD